MDRGHMVSNGQAPLAPDVIVDFLGNIMPFKELDSQLLKDVARHVRVDFFPKGTWLLTMGESEVKFLYLIQQGGVKSFLADDEGNTTLKDYRGEGEYIGALGIIRGTVANMNVETVDDTFCFLLPRDIFLDLIHSQPAFAQYYLKSFSEKIVSTAYTELRKHRVERRSDEDLFLFSIKVNDIIGRTLRRIPVCSSVQDAAQMMMRFSVGSLLLYEDNEDDIVGIITDKDLRNKVVATGMEMATPVRKIMTSPVTAINSQAVCFDALIKMMSCGIHHLAVEENGKILGVITSHDVMLLQGNSPYMLFKEISTQHSYPALYSLAQKIPGVVRNLINEGAKAGNIAQMVALLNDRVLAQLLQSVEQELGHPPLPYCWLLLGCEGRKELTLKAGQENALVYADPEDEHQQRAAALYFKELSKRTINHLAHCGYLFAKGPIMASDPQWCQPLHVWKEKYTTWLKGEAVAGVVFAGEFFDVRCGYGHEPLLKEIRTRIVKDARKYYGYLAPAVEECINRRAPLAVFRDVIVEEDGKQESFFDIKEQGLAPYIKFARILALHSGVRETNTLARLAILAREGRLGSELAGRVQEACEIQMHIQLIHQLHQVEVGSLPDSSIAPGKLSELEKKMLRDGFELVGELNEVLQALVVGILKR